MTFKELKKKSTSDLHSFLAESRNHLRELRFKNANQQLKTVRDIRKLRQEIAWTLTLLNVAKPETAPKTAQSTPVVETAVELDKSSDSEAAKPAGLAKDNK